MPPLEQVIPEGEMEKLSTLQLVDIISHKLVMQGAIPADMTLLRRRVEEMEEMAKDDKINKIYSFTVIMLLHLIKKHAEKRTTRSWEYSIWNASRLLIQARLMEDAHRVPEIERLVRHEQFGVQDILGYYKLLSMRAGLKSERTGAPQTA